MVFNCFTVELNLLTSRAKRTAPWSFNAGLTASLAVLLLILKKPGERQFVHPSRESACKTTAAYAR